MEFAGTEVEALLAVCEHAPDLVAVSDFETDRVSYLNPAGVRLVGLRDGADARNRTTAEFFTDVGLVQAPEVESALVRHGRWEGLSELRHFETGKPIPVSLATFVLHRTGGGAPAVIAAIARDGRRWEDQERRLHHALELAAYRAREQHAVAELSRRAVDGQLTELLAAATTAAATLMGVQCTSVSRPPAPGDPLTVLAYSGQLPRPDTFAPGTGSQPGYALATGSVVVCPNGEDETRFSTGSMVRRGLRSGICVPIPIAARPAWGVLTAHSARPRDYTDREVSFLRTVADVLSATIGRIDAETRLRYQSLHDPLTGLPNRALAYQRIATALTTAHRTDARIAVLLIDLDEFKTVNDRLGHAGGDVALIGLAERLTGAVRPADTVARLGGDEFLVLCADMAGPDEALDLATRIIEAVATPDPAAGHPLTFSASIGIALSGPVSTPEELIRRADLAMYRAKKAGAGRYSVYRDDDGDDADRVLRLSRDLGTALDDHGDHGDHGELTLAYQPLFDLRDGAVVAVEALARWTHPTLGPISATEFIPVAERAGLIGALGLWVLRTACTQAADWQDIADVDIRVNISSLQLHDPRFVAQVADVLAATGLPATKLGLEISEAGWIAETAHPVDTLGALHELGVAIALDNIGTAHSTLTHLGCQRPVFSCCKIDKSYTASLPGRRSAAIVSAVVALAHAFHATVAAAGVENRAQLDALRACGCDLAQGFYLTPPMTADNCTTFLNQDPPPHTHPF